MSEKSKAYLLSRFERFDKPSQIDFIDLFDTLRFATEAADTATNTSAGLVRLASDAQVAARDSVDAAGFQLTVDPSNLPTVSIVGGGSLTVTPTTTGGITDYEIDDSAILTAITNATLTADGTTITISGGNVISIVAGGVGTTQLANDSVDKDKIAADVAGLGLIQNVDGSLEVNDDNSTLELSGDVLQVKDLGITTAKINDLAVTTAKIAASAVTANELAANAVTTVKILDLNVTTAKINDLAVTTAKIDALAVTTAKINDLAVTTAKIALLAVTTATINDLAVTTVKLDNGAVTNAKLDANAVDSSVIADNSIKEADLDNTFTQTVIVIPVSWEAGEQGVYSVWVPYNYTVDHVKLIVNKAISATNTADIDVVIDGMASAATINVPISSPIGTKVETAIAANNVVSYNPLQITEIKLDCTKGNPGGKATVSIILTRNDEV